MHALHVPHWPAYYLHAPCVAYIIWNTEYGVLYTRTLPAAMGYRPSPLMPSSMPGGIVAVHLRPLDGICRCRNGKPSLGRAVWLVLEPTGHSCAVAIAKLAGAHCAARDFYALGKDRNSYIKAIRNTAKASGCTLGAPRATQGAAPRHCQERVHAFQRPGAD